MTSDLSEIGRLTRLYAALRHVHRAIERTTTRDALFRAVCEALVPHAGFGLAWIGWIDPVSNRLVPVAHVGDESGYLDSIDIRIDDGVHGRGPSGIAIREGRPFICNDVLAEPGMAPWRAELERRGFRASAALPVRKSGVVCGALSVYSERIGFFREREVELLTEAAADLSFGLDDLERREEQSRNEAIARREQRFATSVLAALPGIFYLYDQHGRFLRWNRDFERVSGYGADEIAAMTPVDFFASDERALLQTKIAEVFEHGQSSVEASFVSKDGTATPYFFTGKRTTFDGEPSLIGVGIDISERKRAERAVHESETRYRTTLDAILEGCQLLDFEWRYLYLNPAAATQNRRPNAELLGQRMQSMWPGIEHTDLFALLARCMEQRVAVHGEIPFEFQDGSTGWFDVRARPVPEGIFVLSIDISERKRAERALRELNESLEAKVRDRTQELEAARERAESADRIKSAFLATMSHELRTPLNSILGFTGTVLLGMAGPLNAEQTKQMKMVQVSARHLLDLINDVLDISKIEAGQLEVRVVSFDLLASLERVSSAVKPLLDKKALSMLVTLPDELPPMRSDQRRVEQILLNLLNNAIKFTDTGSIALDAHVEGERIRIAVADTGIGMRAEDMAMLFQPFRQIDSGLQRQHEGTGLGLAICRRLAALLGGTIEVKSSWGVGSTFTVELPMRGPKP